MQEVARRAGVFPATVSRVLNKTQSVTEETERRVLDAVKADETITKNVHARQLATGQSDLFGLVFRRDRGRLPGNSVRSCDTACSLGVSAGYGRHFYESTRRMVSKCTRPMKPAPKWSF
jgi:DNA-binding LacI/PurR family transcriptional regulator